MSEVIAAAARLHGDVVPPMVGYTGEQLLATGQEG